MENKKIKKSDSETEEHANLTSFRETGQPSEQEILALAS
jgi:hypothetical protein